MPLFHFDRIVKGAFPLKAKFKGAFRFFDRIEIFFCLTSTQMKLNRNLLNLNNRNFGSIENYRLVGNRLNDVS